MAHSQARELVKQGYTATLVSNTLKISRSSLYYRKRPYRRIVWWMQREKQL